MESETRWRIGEVARQTGLTVRTLHHYDHLGLLVPSERTEAGYRLYTRADLQRLQQILSLRQLGFSLTQIGDCLQNRRLAPRGIIRLQLDRLRREIELRQEAAGRLQHLEWCLAMQKEISGEEFIRVMEGMITMEKALEKYYTPEQLAYLKEKHETLGEEKVRQVQEEWQNLLSRVRGEMDKGTPPTDANVRALARRWHELVEMFTGDNEGITRSLHTVFLENPDVAAAHGLDDKLYDYVARALQKP